MTLGGYVYIIRSADSGRYYIGSTVDIGRRFKEHKQGKHHSSRRFSNSEMVFSQRFDRIEDARKAERRLKAFKRKDFLEKIIKDGIFDKFGAHSSVVRAGDS